MQKCGDIIIKIMIMLRRVGDDNDVEGFVSSRARA